MKGGWAALLLAVAQRQERLRLSAVVGSVLAFAGVLLMSQVALDASISLTSILVALGAAAGSVPCSATSAIVHFPSAGR